MSVDLFFRTSRMFFFVQTSILFSTFLCAAEINKNDEKDNFSKRYEAYEKFLKGELSNENIWVNPMRRDELVAYLKDISNCHIVEIVNILVKKIDFRPYPDRDNDRRNTLEMVYPAYNAIKKCGIPSIPLLIDELKKTNNKNELFKFHLLICCIRDIYEQGISEDFRSQLGISKGEHGQIMASKRIEIEINNTKDAAERVNLKAALEYPPFSKESSEQKNSADSSSENVPLPKKD